MAAGLIVGKTGVHRPPLQSIFLNQAEGAIAKCSMLHAVSIALSNISKSFPGVTALDSVELAVASGEVVALIGENGAGKSTLMKILAGIYQPDSGTIRIGGEITQLRSPRDAARRGIAIIHQELELVD